ncbi:XRE family transcriptional regulator [Metabacillus litoralis]|uniref:XRE family transcriptional regulator n=1 Tax=Metabacillus litoralis TaxID=152268 RepID=A0A5C6VAZ5_9BACI|nr:XRE family transcriptional regulator [Metabacillus litoralis]TXC81566.1 XRE family transcriptional regulator [Metabacillus litoralis]
MNDLLKEKATYWNTRLKKCMDAGRYTQASFAEALNNKYGTTYGQKDVSRWMNTGSKIKNGEVGFPKYDTMVLIADFFRLDVGYLTGETDKDSFSMEKACSYMGLNGEAIKAIREITHPENEASYMRKDMRESFNRYLSAEGFPIFFDRLHDLHLTSILQNKENRVFDNQDSAIDYFHGLEYKGKIARYELNEALVLLVNELYPKAPQVDLNIKE